MKDTRSLTHDPRQNLLLAALSADTYDRVLLLHLELVPLPLGKVLFESGEQIHYYAYFPTDAIVSLLNVMENGASAEIAVVGKEGLIGVSLFMGACNVLCRAIVRSAGYGYRLSEHWIKDEFNRQKGDRPNIALYNLE